MKRHRKKQQFSNRKRIQKDPSKNKSNDEEDVMDDVMAQLRRQREKQKLDEAAASKESITPNSSDAAGNQTPHKSMGKFRYDPILKRYVPKSTYKSNGNNDACIQRMQQVYGQKKNAIDAKSNALRLSVSDRHLSCAINDREIRKVVFRGFGLRATSTCKSSSMTEQAHGKSRKKQRKHKMDLTDEEKWKNKLFACTEKSIVLLTTSLSYCSSARRKNIASILGPMCIARGLEVVATVATTTTLREKDKAGCVTTSDKGKVRARQHKSLANTNQPTKNTEADEAYQLWPSMLHPICLGFTERWIYNDTKSSIPIDCYCKSYLLPTASSFDVLPVRSSTVSEDIYLPHIITITQDNIVNYRAPIHIPPRGLGAFGITKEWSIEEYSADVSLGNRKYEFQIDEPGVPGNIHGIRLAHLKKYSEYYGGLSIGCVTYDSMSDESYFALHCLSDDEIPKLSTSCYELSCGDVNDFCFGEPKSPAAAFALTTREGAAVGLLSFYTNEVITRRMSTELSASDLLCLQYRFNEANNTLLCGHRNGIVSMMDTRSARSKKVVSLSRDGFELEFGSVSSIHQFRRNEHLVIAKGSFGSCCVFDMRRCDAQSSLLMLRAPSDAHYTKSVNCAGLAVDPDESVVISPYVTQKNEVMAGVWSIWSGQLMQSMKLDYSASIDDDRCPLFCELKSTCTNGFRLSPTDESPAVITRKNWGVWYKIRSASERLPAGAGGIQHLSF